MTKEELEKEAEEKYSEVDREFIACQDEGEVFNIGYVLGAEPREKRIAELEAENEANENGAKKYAEYYFETNDQLTKAKEIIKYLLSFIQKENYKTRWDINIAEAEQFLKENE